MRPSGDSQTVTWNPMQSDDDSLSSEKQSDQLSRFSSLDQNIASKEDVKGDYTPTALSVLPPAPKNPPSREEILDEILDLTDQATSVALSGSVGVGNSFVARTILDHSRTKAKFGENRHFMRCDDLSNSLEAFLQRLSDTIRIDVVQLLSSPPHMLLLDGVDSIVDPLIPQSQEISATIEGFGEYEHLCLVTTSRASPDLRGFHHVEVSTLFEDDARDAFYSLCDLPRSPAVDSLITRLDFHPLAIKFLASCVRENGWDEPALLQTWDDDQASVLKTSDYRRFSDAIRPVLRSSTINGLETTALDVLEAIAAPSFGVEERELEKKLAGAGGVVDALCKLSLVYRQEGIVKMFTPARSYFLEPAPAPAQKEQVLCWDVDPMPGACMSLSFHSFHNCGVTFFEGLPVYNNGPSNSGPSRITSRLRAPPGWNWIRGLPEPLIKSDHNISDYLCTVADFLVVSQDSQPS